MKVNNTRLMYLYEAQRCGTMNAASEALDVAPSSVTRQLAALEKELGIALFEKGRRGIKLTEAGELACEHYRERCSHEEAFLSQLDKLKSLKTGTIKVAIGEAFLSDEFSRLISQFMADNPGITVEISIGKTNHVVELVKEDDVHFGLIFDIPRDPKIRIKLALPQPLKVILHPSHPLIKSRIITLSEAAQHRTALPDKTYRMRQIVHMAEDENQTFIDPELTSNSLLLLKDYVKTGKGISFMPEIAVKHELLTNQLISKPTDSSLFNGTKISVVSRLGRQLPNSADLLMRRIQVYLNESIDVLSALNTSG
ncbi:LysR family transcriptional regulator [Pseudomaricurvus alkylphenolicus]|uniref:LysR family transcriptional regulator n=1 Tax=Pseudomaricurvus alkylphenolicus TaxID=1306991 RepID=UPI00141E75EF|nr:LysR family transcriptional regulator [Pseudomaricurvus alkylphenolicus]NIB40303.1 LysR family transcriptional regulator [Pseudomaricurvus alkylphenolicus]